MAKYNKILGSIAGAAVGDAMGAATETRSAERIKEEFWWLCGADHHTAVRLFCPRV